MRTRKIPDLPDPPVKKVQPRKLMKKSTRQPRFLVGMPLDQMPVNQLPMRIHLIQHFLYLRDKFPKKPTKELVACSLKKKTFRCLQF